MNKPMTNYNLYNVSTVVNNTNLQLMTKAINNFLVTFCADWSLSPIQLVIGTYNSHLPIPNNSIFMMDDTDDDSALGYHYEENGNSIGKIFARTILGYGGAILYKDRFTFTVSQCLIHEMLEMITDPVTNRLAMDNSGILYFLEVCDPVESNLIIYTLPGNVKISLSDYAMPSYFSADSTRRPFNKLNTLTSPFSVDNGGYMIIINIIDGYIDIIFGAEHASGTQSLVNINAKEINTDLKELSEKFKMKIKSK